MLSDRLIASNINVCKYMYKQPGKPVTLFFIIYIVGYVSILFLCNSYSKIHINDVNGDIVRRLGAGEDVALS